MSDFFDKEDIVEEPTKETAQSDFWEADDVVAEPAQVQDEGMTQSEAFLRGGAQGLTFDLADEIAGAALAAKETMFGDAKLRDILDTYEQQRDIQREQFAQAEEEFPKSYLAGEIGGGIAPAFLTGGTSAIANVGKTGLKQAAKQAAKAGAKYGAASAFGRTEEIEDLPQVAKDVAVGAGTGAAFGAITPFAEKAARGTVKGGKNLVKRTAKFLGDSLGDLDKEITDKILKDPSLLASAKNYGEVADELLNVSNKELESFRKIAEKGRSTLSKEADMATSDVLNVIDNQLKGITYSDEAARKELSKLRSYIEKTYSKGIMSEAQVQDVMDELAEKAYKGVKKDTADVVVNKLRAIRGELSDKVKEKNPIYAAAMDEASKKKEAIGKAADRFGLVEETKVQQLLDELDQSPQFIKEFKFKNKDSAVSKLKNLGKEGKYTDSELFDDISKIMDIPDEIRRSAMANELLAELEKGKMFTTQDLTMAKALLGAAINPVIGAGMIAARPMVKGFYKNLHKMNSSAANSAMKAFNSLAKKTGQAIAIPAGMQAAKAKQEEIDALLKQYAEKPEKKVLSHEKQMQNMSSGELEEASNDLRKQGHDKYADALKRASETDSDRERAAQEMVLNQQAGFRALMRRKEKEKKK